MTAQYPGVTPTLVDLLEPQNNQVNVTNEILDAVDTTIEMLDTTGLPASGFLTFADGTNEIIFYTSKTGTQLLGVTRGADGSSAQAHANGTSLEMRYNANYHVRQNEEIIAIGTDLRGAFSVAPDDSIAPADVASSIEDRLDMYATRFKDIISGVDWKDGVTRPLNTVNADVLTRVSKSGDIMTGDLVFADNTRGVDFRDSGGVNAVTVKAPGSVTSYNLLWPTAQGAVNSSLFNNGAGQLSFSLIVNSNIDAGASIQLSKMESVTDGNILIGNGSNVLSQVGQSGDVSISNAGVFAITPLAIVDGDINASANIAFSKMASLTVSRLLASDVSGVVSVLGWTHSSNNLTGPAGANIVFSGATSGAMTLQAGDVTVSHSIKWPLVQGSVNQFLQNDGSGNLLWASPAGGGTVNNGLTSFVAFYPGNADLVDDQTLLALTNIGGTRPRLEVRGIGLQAAGNGPTIDFYTVTTDPSTQTLIGRIISQKDNSTPGNPAGSMVFQVVNDAGSITNGIAIQHDGEVLIAQAGSAVLPSLSIVQANLGFFQQASNVIGLATSGVERLRVGTTLNMLSNKVTSVADGTASDDVATFGQIFGGFQAPVQTISTTIFSTTSSTFQTTNCTATITPTSASHRIKISISGFFRNNNAATADAFLNIFRGAVNLASDSANGFARASGTINSLSLNVGFSFIDSPATTSATTYTVRIRNSDNTTLTNFGITQDQIMILEEISAA